MANKSDLRVGDRVRFRPTHNKGIELTGTIVRKHKANELVEVEAEPDGKAIEVKGFRFDAHTSDVTPFPKEAEAKPAGGGDDAGAEAFPAAE